MYSKIKFIQINKQAKS